MVKRKLKLMNDLDLAKLCEEVYNVKPDGEAKEIEYIIRGRTAALRGTGKDLDEFGGLAQDIWRDARVFPWYNRETGAWHPIGILRAGVAIANRLEELGVTEITGHSLAGGTGLIAADIMVARGCQIDKVCVFGSPRVGKLKHLKDINVTLHAGTGDIVTKVPPWYEPIRKEVEHEIRHPIKGYINSLQASTG